MNILVTGGCGFIGSHLTDRLLEEGHKVSVVDNLSTGNIANLNKKATFYQVDVRDSKKIAGVFAKEKPQVVFHFAAQINVRKSEEDPFLDTDININGSVNLIKNFLSVERRKKFIFASTGGAIYGETKTLPTPETEEPFPLSPYGISKLAVEKYLFYFSRFYNLRFTVLRYGNVYGPRQNPYSEAGVVAIFSTNILENVVDANLIMLGNNVNGIFNVGTGIETSVNHIFAYLRKSSGLDLKNVYAEPRRGEVIRSCISPEKITRLTGWYSSIKIEDGIRRTFEWFKKTQ